jgi:DNA-binding transcriptional ArsR family regulator
VYRFDIPRYIKSIRPEYSAISPIGKSLEPKFLAPRQEISFYSSKTIGRTWTTMAEGAAEKQVPILAALAQATRLQILYRVAEAGPRGAAAGEIARAVRCPASTLSFHLKELSRTGLLEGRPRGRFVIYCLRREALRDLARFLAGLAGEAEAVRARKPSGRGARPARGSDRSQLSMFGD